MKRIVLAGVICLVLFVSLWLIASSSDDEAVPKPPASQPKGRAEPDSSNMTKWGPKLSEEELAEIAKLSVPELAEMLRTGDTMHRFAALDQLEADGGWRKNFDLLLGIGGDMVVGGLLRRLCPLKTSAPVEDKQLVDKFLDFLQGQLKELKPSVSGPQAVRSIVRTVFHRDRGLPGMPGYTPPEIPYANDRVINILISCLDNDDWNVREEALNWLTNVGANDPAKIDYVIAALETQLTKEQASQENQEVRARVKAWRVQRIQGIIEALKRPPTQWNYPGGPAMPGMFQPATQPPLDKRFVDLTPKQLIPHVLNRSNPDGPDGCRLACAWFIWKTRNTPDGQMLRNELADRLVEKIGKVDKDQMKMVHDVYFWAEMFGPLGAREQTVSLLKELKYVDCCYGPNLVNSLAVCGKIEDAPILIELIDKESEGGAGAINKALEKLTGVKMPLTSRRYTDKTAWQGWWEDNKDRVLQPATQAEVEMP